MSETTAAVTVPGWQSLVRLDVAEEAERHRQEALRPDLERLRGVAVQIRRIKIPSVSTAAEDARLEVLDALAVAARRVEEITFTE